MRGERCEHGLLSQCYKKCQYCKHARLKRYCRICSPETAYKRFLVKAKSRKLSCSLSYEEWLGLTGQSCSYCGSNDNVNIDRVNSCLGYSSENSVSCCVVCNFMKGTLSKSEFLDHIKRIVDFSGGTR